MPPETDPTTEASSLETGTPEPVQFDANVTPPADPAPADPAPVAFVEPPEQAAEVSHDLPPSDPLTLDLAKAASELNDAKEHFAECSTVFDGFRAEMTAAEVRLEEARAGFNGASARFSAGK